MKTAIMAFLLYSISVVVNAQVRIQMPVYCGDTESWLKTIQKEYKEQPVWTAVTDDRSSVFMLLINEKTQTWTFVMFNEQITCVLATGDNSKLLKD